MQQEIVVGVQALLLGVTYVLAPGPLIIETVRRGIWGGSRAAAAVQGGAFGGELLFALLFISGFASLLVSPELQFGLGMVGAALLVYLGVTMARSMHSVAGQIGSGQTWNGIVNVAPLRLWRHAIVGLMLTVANPYTLIFWFSVGHTTFGTSAWGLSGYLLGVALGSILVIMIAQQLGASRMTQITNWIWRGCAAALILFGVQLGYATLVAGSILGR